MLKIKNIPKLNKSYLSIIFIMLLVPSCTFFDMSDCKSLDPKIITHKDSLSYNIYAIERCLTQGVDYNRYTDSIEVLEYFTDGVKNGISLSVDTIHNIIELRYYKDNKLLNYNLYTIKDSLN